MELENKVIIITGGASGIGRETALLAGAHGAKVVVSDINIEDGEATADKIISNGGDAIFTSCNVRQERQIQDLVDTALKHYGKLDGAFNNAGVGGDMVALTELSDKMWDLTMDINVKAVWHCMKAQIPHMLENGGAIVNTASVAGHLAMRYNAVYTASKHAVIGLTKAAAAEYARKGVRVNALCPGFTDTPMVQQIEQYTPGYVQRLLKAVPMRRLGEASESAEVAVFLLSDRASFMTGQSLIIDGGITLE